MSKDLDRNKTPLTMRLTATAVAYLDGAGFRPIETEVGVAAGWIADIATFIYPTKTSAKRLRLLGRFREEGWGDYKELEYILNRYGHLLTCIVEVKQSKADFQKDLDKKFAKHRRELPAHLCYTGGVKPQPRRGERSEGLPCGCKPTIQHQKSEE